MAHYLFQKLSFPRKASAGTTPGMSSSGPSSGTTVILSPQESLTSPIVHSHRSSPPMPLVVLPPPESRPASGRSRRSSNLFKKLLGKKPPPPRIRAPKSGPVNMWEKGPQGLRLGHNAGTEAGDRSGSPILETPSSSYRMYWDCAKTE
jgi:hypothetical protein